LLEREELLEILAKPGNPLLLEALKTQDPFEVATLKNNSVQPTQPALDHRKNGCCAMLAPRTFTQVNLSHVSAS